MRDVAGVGVQDAGAAGRARLGVAVRVMAEHERDLDLGQLIAPSSGSVTVTVNGMLSPKANVPPSTGVLTTTVGDVLPAVITVLVGSSCPDESVTVRTAV